MNIDKYIGRFKFFLSLSFDPEDVSDIASEYRTYLEEEVKNGSDEKKIIQRYGNPSALANKLRKENELPIIKFGYVVRFAIFSIYCAFSLAIWEHLVNSFLFFSAYFIFSLTIVRFGVTKSGYSHEKDTSEIRFKKGTIITSHLLMLAITIVFIFLNLNMITLIMKEVDVSAQVYLMYYGGILIFSVVLFRSIIGFLYKNRSYFSLICHAMGGIFSLLFLFNQYRNIDSPGVPYNLLLQSFVLYLVGMLFAVVYDFICTKKLYSKRN